MASHYPPDNVIPFNREDEPLDYVVTARVVRTRIIGEPVEFIPSPDRRPTLLERVADFFSSDRGISFQLGFLSGAMFCCGTLILWTKVIA